jgi:hypothetical protein
MGTILEKSARDYGPYMAPDERAEDFVEILASLTDLLSPQGYLECRQVELIAHCDWEVSRHRRQSAQLLSAQVRRTEWERRVAPSPRDLALSGAELAAQAYCANSNHHAHHEEAVAHLERRRHQLLKEFRELGLQRRLKSAEEAEIVSP